MSGDLGQVILERPGGSFEEYENCAPPRFTDAGVEIRMYDKNDPEVLQSVLIAAPTYFVTVGWYR
jgi:hypothetical protein